MNTKNTYLILAAFIGLLFSSCNDYLDQTPKSDLPPESYFTDASQLQAYVDGLYVDILPSNTSQWGYGTFGYDQDTDNQAAAVANNRFADGLWHVDHSESDNWKFELIRKCNYFLSVVLPKYEAGTITGDAAKVKHYIGEVYMLRAYEYFKRYQMFGDFPIITEPLPDEASVLTAASQRSPRNEVARFILSDLDKSIELLQATTLAKTRITLLSAYLVKSRVALFEGTWLKYFKGTAFVPQGEGWPGKDKDYNANYSYPSGSIDNEINYFLEQSISASAYVADNFGTLTENTGTVEQSASDPVNPYLDMFGSVDLSNIPEVLLWRQYNKQLGIQHNVPYCANKGNQRIGVTRGMVNSFLMDDGSPIYASSDYKGDNTIAAVRTDRDSRLSIFLKEPGQVNVIYPSSSEGTAAELVEPYPKLLESSDDVAYSTGYALRKGGCFDQAQMTNGGGYTGAICFRAVEALLNYMEAYYERYGNLDSKAQGYWNAIRARAKISGSFTETIAKTDMSKEAENDWGAYSAGTLVDPTLYNIRRERRCELMAEGLRYMDLCRWRSMDQMITKPYHIEGFHLWNTPMEAWYSGNANFISDGSDVATVSPKSVSEYLRPYEKNSKQVAYTGYTWHMAHYLRPIMIKQFLLTASDGATISTSPIYQNPYWPTTADQPALQ
ncbi:RagB/SusD family nutrient uptake outer membrane protein [uncultured Bacteroides sp.]|uniref:RagB/SusD family nutrient uptake outer membrane protein n=1 Tax=uncultured Bacteroides sp. TaxID=162156 RepID=UPI002AA6E5AD|nr:RagB/SusD family nutrient uptake outer membrane protein [uncultured Bacteroides sp.]